MFLEVFQKYKKTMAERNNICKTIKTIFRNIISIELSCGLNTSAGLICIDSNTLKIYTHDYEVIIFKIIISLNNCEIKTQIIF